MPSPAPIASPNSDEAPVVLWPRYAVGIIASLLFAAVLWPLFKSSTGTGAEAPTARAAVAPACTRWDDRASRAVADFVLDAKHDTDLQRAGDAIFRLRRARRNCNAGWVTLACQDYQVIIQKVPGFTVAWPALSSACALREADPASAIDP